MSTGVRPRSGPGWELESLVILLVFLVTLAIHALSPVTTSTDSAWTFHVAASVLRQGNVNLDEYRPLMNLPLDYRLREIRGHIYSYYPVATPLLVTPVVWLTNLIYPLSHSTDFYTYLDRHAPDQRTAGLEKLTAAGIVALASALMYLIARQKLGIFQSAGIALIFVFATSMWSTASRALWQHGPSALFLTLALYLLVVPWKSPWRIFAVGLVLGAAYLIRPTNSLSVAFIGLYFLINRRRSFWLFAAGSLLVLVPFALSNLITYGNVLPPYSYQLFERLGSPASISEALVGTLISPNRGLLIFSPLFAFSIVGAWIALSQRPVNPGSIELYLIAIIVCHWLTTSLFQDWGGAWSIGPRYFVDIIPYLIYLLIPLFETRVLAKSALRYAFIGSIAVSTLIQIHCSVSIYPFMWNGKPQALVDAPGRIMGLGRSAVPKGILPRAGPRRQSTGLLVRAWQLIDSNGACSSLLPPSWHCTP